LATTAERLTAACLAAASTGADFPTVWRTVLKGHAAVTGRPVQRLDGTSTFLEIPLITGERIVFGPGPKDYALSGGKGAGAVL
jgi:hypothetical protein